MDNAEAAVTGGADTGADQFKSPAPFESTGCS